MAISVVDISDAEVNVHVQRSSCIDSSAEDGMLFSLLVISF